MIRLMLICVMHIILVVSHPVQDNMKIKGKEHEYTCNYLEHHLEFLEETTKDCKKNLNNFPGI